MVFSSHVFLFYFLPLVLLLYYILPMKFRHGALTLLSYVFYGWANPVFILLMLTSTLIDYCCGLVIASRDSLPVSSSSPALPSAAVLSRNDRRIKTAALIVSLVSNLSLLGFFKYFNFFIDSVNAFASLFSDGGRLIRVSFQVALPLGISFYTFQSMSYTIDLYKGKVKVMRNFVDFACYVSLFPQLVAGPIIRFSEVADQLAYRTHTVEKFARGFAFLALGLGKKVLIANPCGKIADLAFGTAGIPVTTAWYGIIAYAFQIYYDFSGYSDMAIGLGLMLGFVFPKNFDSPYISRSITEFWRRWHLSLSYWLRDYLYIPLGGNRKGTFRTYGNLLTVMLLGGLWHGASWNFVIWGGLHGLVLAAERAYGGRGLARLPDAAKQALTFGIILITWVFFRADTLPAALSYLGAMFGAVPVTESARLINPVIHNPYYLVTFFAAAGITWFGVQTWDWTRQLNKKKMAAIAGLFLVSVFLLTSQDFNPFIYFIF
ncbi:MAG: MBOAT family protein [Spirochaetales bacterium]|nr:MBOAT family protein [Spirochaetales bacterium]